MKNGWYEVEKDGFPQSESGKYLTARRSFIANMWTYDIAYYRKDLSTLPLPVGEYEDIKGEGFYYSDDEGFDIPLKVRYWKPINNPEEEGK